MEKNESHIYINDLGEGLTFRSISGARFKNTRISVHFSFPIDREEVTLNSLLASLLCRTCAKYPENRELNRALTMLYGASNFTSFGILGNCQMMSFEISFIDDRFVPGDECISGKCAGLLSDIVFRPLVGDDGFLFSEDELAYCLKNTEESIKSRINDKEAYAACRCIDIMCEGEPITIESGGYLEDLPKVTRQELTRVWRKMLSIARVDITAVGSEDYGFVKDLFVREFRAIERRCAELPWLPPYKEPKEVREVTERMDVKQSRMIMGFRVPVLAMDDKVTACRLMSSLFGKGSRSLLYKNVREKLSLCYYCYSSYHSLSGTMFVYCGIDESNKEKAVEEIRRQLEIIANNEFTDEEFDAVKLYTLCSLDSRQDYVGGLSSWYANQIYAGVILTPEQEAERLKSVTRDQVAECASLVRLDTIYMLAPEKPEEASKPEGGKG